MNENYLSAVHHLHVSVNEVGVSTKKGKIVISKAKSIRVDFTLRSHLYNPVYLDGQVIRPNTLDCD